MDDEEYSELPAETRRFLARLREEDIKDLAAAVDFMHSVGTVGRFLKWVLLLTAGTFVAAASLGDSAAKIAKWFNGNHQ